MSINALVKNLSPEAYENLRAAVETGKWPDGAPLTQAQKDHSLQLVMAYQSKVLKSTEHFSVGADGHIVSRSKAALKDQFKPSKPAPLEQAPLKQAPLKQVPLKQAGIARFTHDDI